MAQKTYSEKLKDPRWQKKRLEILERDNWECKSCSDTENTLHVHHKFYENKKEPWEYDNECLITLCADCHILEAEQMNEYTALFIETFKRSHFLADNLRELAWGLSNLELLHAREVVASAYSFALKNKNMQQLILDEFFKSLGKNG